MLPEVSLRPVAREDVVRLGAWLRDEEVSSRWFGHYACGDPVHRGYDPDRIIGATDAEWERVFRYDPQRFIFSVCDEYGDHIGEAQALLDDGGGAELSLLIGRKDLWHRGYGTSTMISMLDQVFRYYELDRAWVNVPMDNTAALGLFTKLGFVEQETRELCRRPEGSYLHACILSMEASEYVARQPRRTDEAELPVITISGPPGSGSDVIGADIARIAGVRFVDGEIEEEMCKRLGCSSGELEAFEANCHSWVGRLLNAFQGPWEQYSAYDGLYDGYGFKPLSDHFEYYEPQEPRNERALRGCPLGSDRRPGQGGARRDPRAWEPPVRAGGATGTPRLRVRPGGPAPETSRRERRHGPRRGGQVAEAG